MPLVVLLLCDNCNARATRTWTLDTGGESHSCEKCRPGNAVAARELDAPPPEEQPLTIEEAAARVRKDKRTIYRWAPELEKTGGARKIGGAWLIDRAALDAYKTTPRRKAEPKKPTRPKPTAKTETDWFDA